MASFLIARLPDGFDRHAEAVRLLSSVSIPSVYFSQSVSIALEVTRLEEEREHKASVERVAVVALPPTVPENGQMRVKEEPVEEQEQEQLFDVKEEVVETQPSTSHNKWWLREGESSVVLPSGEVVSASLPPPPPAVKHTPNVTVFSQSQAKEKARREAEELKRKQYEKKMRELSYECYVKRGSPPPQSTRAPEHSYTHTTTQSTCIQGYVQCQVCERKLVATQSTERLLHAMEHEFPGGMPDEAGGEGDWWPGSGDARKMCRRGRVGPLKPFSESAVRRRAGKDPKFLRALSRLMHLAFPGAPIPSWMHLLLKE